MAVAVGGDEIHVAGGTYTPDQDEGGNVTLGDREATLQLISGVAILGGYAGLADLDDPDYRDISLHESVLSGNLNGDDGPDFQDNSEDSYHVVLASGTNEATIPDGFTLTAGNADEPDPSLHRSGGGIYNSGDSNVTLSHCNFRGNSAAYGGGFFNSAGSPTLEDCVFDYNGATALEGGIYNYGETNPDAQPTFVGCTFTENSAVSNGGGMRNWDCSPTLVGCTFDRSGVANAIGVFSRDVDLIDERIDGDRATVAIQVDGRVPLDEVTLVQEGDHWLIQTDPPIPGLAKELRNLAQVLIDTARMLDDRKMSLDELRRELTAREAAIGRRIKILTGEP